MAPRLKISVFGPKGLRLTCFGGNIVWCALYPLFGGPDLTALTQINNLDGACFVDQDVIGLHIAVHIPMLMHGIEP